MKKVLKYAFILFGILFFFPIILCGQHSRIDSLNNALKSAKSDTTKLHLLVQLSEECDVPDILKYAKPALDLADKLLQESSYSAKVKKHILNFKAHAINNIGFMHNYQGDIPSALEYYSKSLKLEEETGDNAGGAE